VGLDPCEQAVLKKWKSLRLLQRYLRRELELINQRCFAGKLSLPKVLLDRMRYSRDLAGDYVGARYLPPNREQPARIHIFPFFLLDKKDIQLALAHELVHHWEHESSQGLGEEGYPEDLPLLFLGRFQDARKREAWLHTHSPNFLQKSTEVAQSLGLPLKDFLFR